MWNYISHSLLVLLLVVCVQLSLFIEIPPVLAIVWLVVAGVAGTAVLYACYPGPCFFKCLIPGSIFSAIWMCNSDVKIGFLLAGGFLILPIIIAIIFGKKGWHRNGLKPLLESKTIFVNLAMIPLGFLAYTLMDLAPPTPRFLQKSGSSLFSSKNYKHLRYIYLRGLVSMVEREPPQSSSEWKDIIRREISQTGTVWLNPEPIRTIPPDDL